MIKLEGVTKKYMNRAALRNVNLQLSRGKIVGLVGENGSGKSTALKLMAGLSRPSKGSVTINGMKANHRIANQVAYLSELDEYYGFFNVGETIDFFASQFADFNTKKAEEIRTFMKLDRQSKLKHLSKGNRGRLKIVLTLAREAPVILMDEPLSGLDPMVRSSIVRGLLSFIDLEKQLILIATHEVREVEMLLDEVIAIKDGDVVAHHNVEQLRSEEALGIVEWMTKVYE